LAFKIKPFIEIANPAGDRGMVIIAQRFIAGIGIGNSYKVPLGTKESGAIPANRKMAFCRPFRDLGQNFRLPSDKSLGYCLSPSGLKLWSCNLARKPPMFSPFPIRVHLGPSVVKKQFLLNGRHEPHHPKIPGVTLRPFHGNFSNQI
jgi:hypothetical protein